MSFRFWNLLFQLASRMEPGISRFINQFLEHEMLLRLLSADRKKRENFYHSKNSTELTSESRNENKPLKTFILCNEIRFSRKKRDRRVQNKEKKRKYRVNKQYKPNLFYFKLIKFETRLLFFTRRVFHAMSS
jgi:hypothetical protein